MIYCTADIHGEFERFRRLLEQSEAVRVMRVSEAFANKGTKRFFRMYAEVEKEAEARSESKKRK